MSMHLGNVVMMIIWLSNLFSGKNLKYFITLLLLTKLIEMFVGVGLCLDFSQELKCQLNQFAKT